MDPAYCDGHAYSNSENAASAHPPNEPFFRSIHPSAWNRDSQKFPARNSHMADDPPLVAAHTCPSWLQGGSETRPPLLQKKG